MNATPRYQQEHAVWVAMLEVHHQLGETDISWTHTRMHATADDSHVHGAQDDFHASAQSQPNFVPTYQGLCQKDLHLHRCVAECAVQGQNSG